MTDNDALVREQKPLCYKLPVRRVENYSGEHREWIEEYVLPNWLVNDIAKDALDRHRAGDDALREENERLRAEAESIRYIMNLSVEEFEALAAHALAAVTGGRE